METPLPSTDVLFQGHIFRFAIDHVGERDLLIVKVYSADGHTFLGQPIRFWQQGAFISGDRPGVQSPPFDVDGSGRFNV